MKFQSLLVLSAAVLIHHVQGRETLQKRAVPEAHENSTKVLPNAFIVEFVDGTLPGLEHPKFRAALADMGIPFKERTQFSDFMNALSIHVDSQHIKALSSLPNVKTVWPVVNHKRDLNKRLKQAKNRTEKHIESLPSKLISSPHLLTGVDKVHKLLKNTGSGIRVGVIDTGIDYTHPALGGCFKGKNCRVQYGYDFVGDGYDDSPESLAPDADPKDCDGHGTHVAGIIGAKDKNFVGVAPDVIFGAYKVFGCDSNYPEDMVIKAIEMAVKDKMHVINLSMGSSSPFPDDPLTRALNKAVDKGVVVTVAVGNSGSGGLWTSGTPSTAKKVTSVGSVDNLQYPGQAFQVNGFINHTKAVQYVAGWDGRKPVKLSKVPLAATVSNPCEPFVDQDYKGKIVLLNPQYHNFCSHGQQALYAQQAGAVGAMAYYANLYIPGSNFPGLKIPLVGIDDSTAAVLNEQVMAGANLTVSFGHAQRLYKTPNGGKLSDFSSWGPDFQLNFKPDLVAPGGTIYSTYPVDQGSYVHMDGTSMSSPYVAGSAALYVKAKGKVQASSVLDVLQNTAKPLIDGNRTVLDTTVRQGAGLIDVYDAIRTKFTILPAKLALNDTVHLKPVHVLKVRNRDHKLVTFRISHLPALTVNGYDNKQKLLTRSGTTFLTSAARVRFDKTRITIPPGGTASISARFAPPKVNKNDLHLYSGFIKFTPTNKRSPTLNVPYLGASGDFGSRYVVKKGTVGNEPFMFSEGTREEQTKYTFKDKDHPIIYLFNNHPTALVSGTLLRSGKVIGSFVEASHIPREVGFDYSFVRFDGTVTKTFHGVQKVVNVPNGSKYRLKLEFLRPFGNPKSKKDYDVWVSDEFQIRRAK
ncbi:subtilisin-like protein [Basidiobolus meristosporus CBS 931.73]|uniref:Subtilisin-like protein n=1 Tax=Basidiobolus meristosporus CBS 931.73 TaxID=1314790 RepID=A0A1Y1X423_9FUNG|nr:subtilisin-like protein [Basidiobolus meristosporus CBS 931.73]|eukprot:ORX80567.1 subtilisin-like protein [Basidiobolus meristosporus CBS 931.73]